MVQIRILCSGKEETGMRRSFLPFIALAVFLLFLLLACGGGNEESHPPTTTRPWTQQFGTPYNDIGHGVALDGSGNIYITGSTGGDLDGHTSEGLLDILLSKFGSSGNRVGSKQFGTSGDDIANAVAIDPSGNIYITGSTGGSLPGWTSSGGKDIFLAKVDSSGNILFTEQFGTAQDDVAYGIAIDTSGNIYITGSTGGNLGATSAGGLDIFLTKFDSSGNRIFTQQFGTNQDDIGYGVVVDIIGNIYITGSTKGILGSSSFGLQDVFLAKFNSSWVNQFIVQFGSGQDDVGYSIALSGTDNIYITGSTGGNLPGNTSSGLTDIFLAKFNSSGANQFLQQLGTTGRDVGNSVAVDGAGNVYVAGSTEGGLLGNSAFGLSDIFLVKFNSSGVTQFARQLGTSSNDIAYGLAIQGTDIYITGSTEGNLDGNTSFGLADIFLAKYDTSGVKK
jgi:Beta-propeller repeat